MPRLFVFENVSFICRYYVIQICSLVQMDGRMDGWLVAGPGRDGIARESQIRRDTTCLI